MASEDDSSGQTNGQWLERWRTSLIWGGVFAAIIIVGRVTPIKPVQRVFGSFGWLTKQAVSLTSDLFERYGEWVVFFGPLLENTIFLGALIPGTLLMLLAGVAIRDGFIDIRFAIPLGIAGAIIGDTISYGIGRFGWKRLGPDARIVRWAERMREPLLNQSTWLVLSYHFAGYSRLVGPAASGFLRMPFRRWMVLDYIGVSLWVVSFIMGGYLLGVAGLSLDDSSERSVQIFEIILFSFFAIAIVTVMRRAGGQRKDTHEDDSADSAPKIEEETPVG